MTKQTDKSKQLTDKASEHFEVASGYEKGSDTARGMNREEAVDCLPDQVVKEESRARPELEKAVSEMAGEQIGKITVEKDAWEVFEGD